MNQVAILHGWSDNSESFKPLANFLKARGYQTVPIWLGDYNSMDDDVGIEDVAKRMEVLVAELQARGELGTSFHLIVHSTGGLVARKWLADYYDGITRVPPVKRLVMLAPANFGSRLATIGKSILGRAFKGFNNRFETGTRMLDALELGSAFAWALTCRDLLVDDAEVDDQSRIYGENATLPFVIVGTRGYKELARQLVNEDGADGTVRVAAANLNVRGITLDLAQGDGTLVATQWTRRFAEPIPCAVLPDRDHTSIVHPDDADDGGDVAVPEKVGDLILAALSCADIIAYRALASAWSGDDAASISERTAKAWPAARALQGLLPGPYSEGTYHQYMQIVVHVVDDHGADVTDYFLEYPSSDSLEADPAATYFQRNVLEKVSVNSRNSARRTLYVDRTDLMNGYYPKTSTQQLLMRVVAANIGPNVGYFSAPGAQHDDASNNLIRLHSQNQAERWLSRNQTHLVKIIIPRVAVDDVFALKRA